MQSPDPRLRLIALLMMAVSLVAGLATSASAKYCGDNAGGVRVPCACGDTVTSDTRLQPSDPVVNERCPLDGLMVAPPMLADSITIDLNGLTISGAPYGIGIRVLGGGSSGAIVLGCGAQRDHAEIIGFRTGIESRLFGSVARIENVEVRGARRHGLWLRGRGVLLSHVTASSNGGDGIYLAGQGGRLVGVIAFGNAGNGVTVLADASVIEVDAEHNGKHGVLARGRNPAFGEVRTIANGAAGVVASNVIESATPSRIVSEGNGRDDRIRKRGTGKRP